MLLVTIDKVLEIAIKERLEAPKYLRPTYKART